MSHTSSHTKTVSTVNTDTDVSTIVDNSMTHFQLVGVFHDKFEYPSRKELYIECFDVEPKLIPSRISFFYEELNEFKVAFKGEDDTPSDVHIEPNPVEMADALCDLAYFVYGTGQCLGINLDESMKRLNVDVTTPKHFNRDIIKKWADSE